MNPSVTASRAWDAPAQAPARDSPGDDHAALGRAIAASLCAACVPEIAREMVRRAIELGERPLTVHQLAVILGVSRKSLDRRLRLAASPITPRQAIVWGRLIALAIELEHPRATVADVARRLRFRSPGALRNMLKRRAGLTPTALRAAGGHAAILSQFRRRVGAAH